MRVVAMSHTVKVTAVLELIFWRGKEKNEHTNK